MLTERMEKALNDQVNAELFSSYLYLSMASYFHSVSLNGFARWMQAQALEEMTHAMKFYSYINDRGKQVLLQPIGGPETTWSTPLEVFEEVLKHEQKVTSLINNLVDIAAEERDHATHNMLQWFVAEQVEEEATADDVIQKIKLIENTKAGLFMVDQELGQRIFTLPPGTTLIGGLAGGGA